MNRLIGWDDTIVALATVPGVSSVAVIRLSGGRAIEIAQSLFSSAVLSEKPSHSLHVGLLKDDNEVLDEVVLGLFRTPSSYTGEDVVEISTHGSPYIVQRVMDACIRKGARLARPGEFTQRAFLNGKMDLIQAEAVADLIASNTRAAQKAAIDSMRGGFSKKLKEMREQLLQFSALIELELDFSQEDVEFADRPSLVAIIQQIRSSVQQLLESFRLGNVIKQGVSVAIVGKPNSGKSTLLNALLQEERAIVSDIPGTTRDTVEEVMNIDGILFRLIDTAGIRKHTGNEIERIGIGKSLEKMKQADLVLYVLDAADPTEETLRKQKELEQQKLNYLFVINKADTWDEISLRNKFGAIGNAIFISARTHQGLGVLKEKMTAQVLTGSIQTEGFVLTNARHYHALYEVEKSLDDISSGLDQKLTGDLLAADIRRCLHYLGEITGEVTSEDVLDYIFSKFCIGK